MARNIPNNATLKALTTLSGKTLPAIVPSAVPTAQQGPAKIIAPYV